MEESDSLQEDAVPSLPQNQGTSQLQPDLDPCPTAEANEELKCDVGLVFAKEDEDLANDIMDEMQTVEIAGSAIVVRLFNDVIFGGDIVDRPQVVCEHCTIVYIVHTENTTKDLLTNFTKNEAISEIRIEKGGDNIRSLRTKEGLQSLSGLASMQTLDWYKPSKLKKLADIIEHERKQLKDTSISSKMTALTLQPRVNEQGVTFDGAGDGGQEITELVSPEAHFFIGYATVPGKKALRNEETGSWYIQALIKVLEESAHSKDFLSLMTDVKRVLHERQCESAEGDFLKQAAMSASSFLRKL